MENTQGEHAFMKILSSSQLNANVLLVKLSKERELPRSENKQNALLLSHRLGQGPGTQVKKAQHFHRPLPFSVSSGWDSSEGLS